MYSPLKTSYLVAMHDDIENRSIPKTLIFIENLARLPLKLQKPENRRFLKIFFSDSTFDLVNCVMVVWKTALYYKILFPHLQKQ